MPLPIDAYPLATQDGQQIRLDLVRVIDLNTVAFNNLTGSAVNAGLVVIDAIYVFFATSDCIVAFTGIASKTLNNTPAVLVAAGERVTCLLPVGATGISTIGLSASGILYIQKVAAFAGLANTTTLGNQ